MSRGALAGAQIRDGKSANFDQLELRMREQVFPRTVMEANLLRYLIRRSRAIGLRYAGSAIASSRRRSRRQRSAPEFALRRVMIEVHA
jgi:hypothetical protein